MVTMIGYVSPVVGSIEPPRPRRFTVDASIYDATKAAPAQFSVVCFLEDTKRWEKFRTPSAGAFLSITAKVAGRTADTNQLALRVLDFGYLPRSNFTAPTTATALTPPTKRAARWDGRAPTTPPKRARGPERSAEAASPTEPMPVGCARWAGAGPTSPSASASPCDPISPATAARDDEDVLTQLESDGTSRPHRNRSLRRSTQK